MKKYKLDSLDDQMKIQASQRSINTQILIYRAQGTEVVTVIPLYTLDESGTQGGKWI